ncbi:hypothetical protein YT1_p20030 (plasmid) [Rhodococcus ruber]|nr:hypothetical protein YT1_p20030 [Rhodococcus ruber]
MGRSYRPPTGPDHSPGAGLRHAWPSTGASNPGRQLWHGPHLFITKESKNNHKIM